MTSLKAQLAAGTVCALVVESASPAVVEMAGGVGFSGVVLDARHGALSPFSGELEDLVRAATAAGVPALVRSPEAAPGTLNRCLNDGADGVVVPAVDDVDGAQRAAAATRYPPLGRRGAAPVVRAARFGLQDWEAYVRETNDERLVLCSLETWEAVGRAGSIAAVTGVDGVVLDLPTLASADGGPPGPADPRLAAALGDVATAGGVAAVVTADGEEAVAWARAGARLVLLHGDLLAASRKARELRRSLDTVPASVGAVR
jgi:2-keto-3-deoxy-L-rhamnonate aldolase RhmA